MTALERAWYGPRRWLWLLWPLQSLMRAVVWCRFQLYRLHWLESFSVPAPVIVVGNITVGGTGKTPLTVFVVQQLQAWGYRPGIVSRGYGSRAPFHPFVVKTDADVMLTGDEPMLLALHTDVPVIIDPDRVRGARALIEAGCNIVVSDDGLQHYRLRRDIEIHVLDAVRQLGNRWLLPAGPLRESASRLSTVDLRVANGVAIAAIGEHGMQLQMLNLMSLDRLQQQPLSAFYQQRVHAVAGIGNPERFFQQLERLGWQIERHVFADHHAFTAADLPWTDAPIVMTEKDAVKCRGFANDNMWYVPVKAHLPATFADALQQKLRAVMNQTERSNHG